MMLFSRTIGPVPVDAVIRETIQSRLKITERPVETGADITDHAYLEPKRITLEGIIGGSMLRSTSGGRTVAVAGWQALKALQESRKPFTLISGLDIHKNILIEDITAERDKEYSWVLRFTAQLREIQIVSSAYSSASQAGAKDGQARGLTKSTTAKGATTEQGSPVAQRGDISPTGPAASTPAAGDNGSILHGIFN